MKILNLFLLLLLFSFKIAAQAPPPPPPPPQVDHSKSKPDSLAVFTFAEEQPVFPGGSAAFMKYLQTNIQYPQLEKEANKQGSVYISFIVEKDGSISNIKAVKEVPGAPGLTKEAIRVISMMPKWIPGKMNGRAVRVEITQPIKFVLDNGPVVPKPIPDCGTALSNTDLVMETNPGRIPVYPGGDSAMQIYAKKTILIHKKQFADMSDKTIRISFVVNREGKVEDVFIKEQNGATREIALIAAQLICSMPQWTPGGGGLQSNPKHSNMNVRMTADVYLGKYEKKKILFQPKITVLPMLIQGPPPKKVQPPPAKFVQPEFNGGDSALAVFIQQNLVYPQRAKNAGIQGTVLVSFVVSQDGSITYASALEEVAGAPELTEEALRLVNSMPKWNPGSIKGVTSQMVVKLPVKFEIKK